MRGMWQGDIREGLAHNISFRVSIKLHFCLVLLLYSLYLRLYFQYAFYQHFLHLATAGSALITAFPTDFEAENALDILTDRAIDSACSTPVYRSLKTLWSLLVLISPYRMNLKHASKHLAAQKTASAWQDTVPTT